MKQRSKAHNLEPVPSFMFLDSYQQILDDVHLGLEDDDGPDNSRDAAVNFVSASARFTKERVPCASKSFPIIVLKTRSKSFTCVNINLTC